MENLTAVVYLMYVFALHDGVQEKLIDGVEFTPKYELCTSENIRQKSECLIKQCVTEAQKTVIEQKTAHPDRPWDYGVICKKKE